MCVSGWKAFLQLVWQHVQRCLCTRQRTHPSGNCNKLVLLTPPMSPPFSTPISAIFKHWLYTNRRYAHYFPRSSTINFRSMTSSQGWIIWGSFFWTWIRLPWTVACLWESGGKGQVCSIPGDTSWMESFTLSIEFPNESKVHVWFSSSSDRQKERRKWSQILFYDYVIVTLVAISVSY